LSSTGPSKFMHVLREFPEERRRAIAAAARKRLLLNHTPAHRAKQLESYYREVIAPKPIRERAGSRLRPMPLQVD
jgi:hypothetical protein